MSIYIKAKWIHAHPDDPVEFFSELDVDQWEQRKVEVFSDGHKGFADKNRKTEDTMLGLEPWPDLVKLGMEPQFKISKITKEEFEVIWAEAIS